MTILTSAEIEDLRAMYSEWVELSYAQGLGDPGLQLRCHDIILKLMRERHESNLVAAIPASEPSGSGYGMSKTGHYGPG